jgi:hypothetical protein
MGPDRGKPNAAKAKDKGKEKPTERMYLDLQARA